MAKVRPLLAALAAASLLLDACGGGGSHGSGSGAQVSEIAELTIVGVAAPGEYVPSGSSQFPNFIYPQPGDPHADIKQPMQWSATAGARGYQVQIGTSPGADDVYDSGVITSTSMTMPALPAAAVLYARVRAVLQGWSDALPAGHWPRGAYTEFRLDNATPASTFVNLADGGTLSAGAALEWNATPLATGYRLELSGATFHGDGGADSGLIHTTRMLISAAANAKVTATLTTLYLTGTASSKITFTAVGGDLSFTQIYNVAKKLTADVRSMADRDNQLYGSTLLASIANGEGLSTASCQEFMLALRQLLADARIGIPVRTLDIAFQEDGLDTHTLVEVEDESSSRWSTLDPTFGLVTLRADGTPATSADISAAARSRNWSALKFTLLNAAGSTYANDYYVDYPLLYLNVSKPDLSGLVQSPLSTLTPYFDALPLPVDGDKATYALKCAAGASTASADIDSASRQFGCSGADQISNLFAAYGVQLASAGDGAVEVWRLHRASF